MWSPHKKKACVNFGKIQGIATKMVPNLEDLAYKERLSNATDKTKKKRRGKGDIITIYELMNNLEEIDKKLIMKRKVETRYLRGDK